MAQKNKSRTDASGNASRKSRKTPMLEKFFHDQLKDIYYAEQQLLKALVDMKEAATTEELEDAFENHHKQTARHVKRLEKIFTMLDKKAEGKKCDAMDGLISEAQSIIKETKEGTMTRDAALIIAAQKVEHYEIASYGGLVQLAITLGKNNVANLLDKTLSEEEETDQLLTDIAEEHVKIEAEEEDAEETGDEEEETEAISTTAF